MKDTGDTGASAFSCGPVHNLFHTTVGDLPGLVGLITGTFAEDSELLSEDVLRSRVVQQIQTMYQVQDEPITYVAKRWGLEEFSGGCYAGVCPPDGSLVRLGPFVENTYWEVSLGLNRDRI